MTTTEAVGEGLTFEKVWAAIQATNEQLRIVGEHIRATDAQMKETAAQMKETDERMKATDERMKATDAQIKATGEQMKETDRRLGSLTNRFGEMVEYMIVPKLEEKFRELGFAFEKTHRNSKIRDQEHGIFTEIDAFLENGDRAMVVEIKNKPNVDDINDHVERMEKLRSYADFHADTRKYLGAIAGVVFGESEKTYALKKGFYVIEPSGDTFTITEPSGDYHPHEW
jgi:hypothetical protein